MLRAKNTTVLIATAVVTLALAAGGTEAAGVGRLNSALSANQAHAKQISAALASSNDQVQTLDGQISLLNGRLASVQSDLNADEAKVADDAANANRARAAERRFE